MTTPTPSRWLPLLMAISIFMQMLDATILNTALPTIAADLGVSPLNMQSAVISYALTVALLIPASGYLADRFGTKKTFIIALVVFMLGSLLCAVSTNLPMLVEMANTQAMDEGTDIRTLMEKAAGVGQKGIRLFHASAVNS